MELTKKLKALF